MYMVCHMPGVYWKYKKDNQVNYSFSGQRQVHYTVQASEALAKISDKVTVLLEN